MRGGPTIGAPSIAITNAGWTGKQATREADGLVFDQAASESSPISQ